MKRSKGYTDQLNFLVGFLVGGVFLFVATLAYLDTIPFLVKAKSVQGTVVELVPIPNDSSENDVLYAPKVVFWEETRERRFEFISSVGSDPPAYNEDERVTVFYDPENPENAKIGVIDLIVGATFFAFLPGAFCCWAVFLKLRKRRKIMRQNEK